MKNIFKYIILVFGVLIYLFLNENYNINIECLFYKFTKLYCPGCGITRMLKAMLDLNFYQAFRYNMLVFILLILFIIYIILKLIFKLLKKDFKVNNKVYYVLLIITLLFGILRNFEMFNYLAPIKL